MRPTRLFWLGGFLASTLQAGTINLGVLSYDTIRPGVAAFQILNLTGDPLLGGSALPPDFPVYTPLTFRSATLTITQGAASQLFFLADLAPGAFNSAALEFPDTALIDSAFFTATLSSTVLMDQGGAAYLVSPDLRFDLFPPSGSFLVSGDFAILQATEIPEPGTLILALLGWLLIVKRRSVLIGWLAIPLAAQVTLSPTGQPSFGAPGATTIQVTGSNFPSGAILPQDVTVTLEPAAGGAAVTTTATSVATIVGSTRRVAFVIPAALDPPLASLFRVGISSSGPVAFNSGASRANLTVNPRARIPAVSPASVMQGQTLAVLIVGNFTSFVNGVTRARFGAGISVGGGPAGEFGPVLVQSPVNAIAQIAMLPDVALGPRTVEVQTGGELAALAGGFTVTATGVIPSPQGVTLSTTTDPPLATPGTSVIVTGTGFPREQIPPNATTVTLEPAPGAATTLRTTTAGTHVPGTGGAGSVIFQIPSTLRLGVNTAFRVGLGGRTAAGTTFAGVNTAALTIQATTGRLLSAAPASEAGGRFVAVTVRGQFANFQNGLTDASFGAGISVGGGPVGGFGPVTVQDADTLTAGLSIDNSAPIGPRTLVVRKGAEQFMLVGGFAVVCRYGLTPASLDLTSAGGPGVFSIFTGTPCPWTVATSTPWLTITSSSQGSGPATATFTAARNETGAARNGSITAGSEILPVTQGGCFVTLSKSSFSIPRPGITGAEFDVIAPAGCSWTAAADQIFVHLRPGVESGTGTGTVIFDVDQNPTAAVRRGTITVAGVAVTITQDPASRTSCVVNNTFALATRTAGLTEKLSDLVMSCVPEPGMVDVVVTLNVPVGGKTLDDQGTLDAVLLVDNPPAPVRGVNAFLGRLDGPNRVRFSGIPLFAFGTGTRSVRITNLRGQVNLLALRSAVTADVAVEAVPAAQVTDPHQFIGVVAAALQATRLPDGSDTLTVRFSEGTASAFRVRTGESMFVAPGLGPDVGTAWTGTRLHAWLAGVPAGVRVFAPAYPLGNMNAVLVSPHPYGAGIGYVPAVPLFGGFYEEVTLVGGEGTATWEVVADDQAAIETLDFRFVILGATSAQLAGIRATLVLAPIRENLLAPRTVPLFADPSVPIPIPGPRGP